MLRERLRRTGGGSFRSLTADCAGTLEVVARFLGLLELYREGVLAFEQVEALGDLHVRWLGGDDQDADAGAGAEFDEDLLDAAGSGAPNPDNGEPAKAPAAAHDEEEP